ncbi:hypothetical protein WG947_07395 [Pontibacter sp. H259]|uniref:hypothetical protein n=1 Tax=Pontibacter sp. H259 TaxID=3133421 RepID=UPI0030C5A0A1
MDKEEAYNILDALAEGCSPFTGEQLENDSILNERKVIRALQIALDALNTRPTSKQQSSTTVQDSVEVKTVMTIIEVMKAANIEPSVSKVSRFLLGSKQFKESNITQNGLYGSLKHSFTYRTLNPTISQLAKDNNDITTALTTSPKEKPWDSVDFFEQPQFCTLSEKAIDQLKNKINELGILKQPPHLSDYVISARTEYARAYEPWSSKELEYLGKALKYTNDLQLLSVCFQRGENSLRTVGKKLIYEYKVNET